MPWGSDLWDKRVDVEKNTLENIKAIDAYRSMAKEMATAEHEYSATLKEIAAKYTGVYQHQQQRFDGWQGGPTTGEQVWHTTLCGLGTSADVHHQFGEVLERNVSATLKSLQHDAIAIRSKIVAEAKELSIAMEKELDALEKVRSKFDKAEAKARKAHDAKKEAEKTGKGDTEKLHKKWVDQSRVAEGEEKLLKAETDRVNAVRVTFYHTDMQAKMNQMEAADRDVAVGINTQLYEIGKAFNAIQGKAHTVATAIHTAVQKFDPAKDTTMFTSKVQSGKPLPEHLPLHPSRDLGYANPTPAAAPASAVNSASGTSYYTPASSVRDAVSPEVSRENSLAEGGERGGAAAESAPPPPPPVEAPGCQALYDFPGAQQGELSTTAGEVLDMLEDDGSGWVLAGRRDGSGRQGFVPATYIQKM